MNPTKPITPPGPKPAAPPVEPVKQRRQFKFDTKNLRTLMLATLGLSILAFLIVLLVGLSWLGKESQKVVDLKVKNQTADAQLANLEQAKKQVDKYSFFKDVARTVIPNDKDQATAIAEINDMARESGINLQTITFPASSLGLGTATTSATVTQQDATAKTSTSKAISQAKPVAGIPDLYSLSITITPQSDDKTPKDKIVTFDKILTFLKLIERNRHTAQITDVDISPPNSSDVNGSKLTFSITTNIFIKP